MGREFSDTSPCTRPLAVNSNSFLSCNSSQNSCDSLSFPFLSFNFSNLSSQCRSMVNTSSSMPVPYALWVPVKQFFPVASTEPIVKAKLLYHLSLGTNFPSQLSTTNVEHFDCRHSVSSPVCCEDLSYDSKA